MLPLPFNIVIALGGQFPLPAALKLKIKMNIYSTVQRGFEHKLYCEDAAGFWQPLPGLTVAVVSDGCSGGSNSHFASALTVKIIGKIVNSMLPYLPASASETGGFILQQFMQELLTVKQALCLETGEILATLLLAVVYRNTVWIAALGDGVIAIDGDVTELNHQNTPDYPAYHLHKSKEEQTYYLFKQVFQQTGFTQFAIATDGILSFTSSQQMPAPASNEPVITYLLKDNGLQTTQSMLSRKCNLLYSKHGLLPADDVAVIKIINRVNS